VFLLRLTISRKQGAHRASPNLKDSPMHSAPARSLAGTPRAGRRSSRTGSAIIRSCCLATLAVVAAAPSVVLAQSDGEEQTTARFQTTYIWQRKPAFDARYSGARSLVAARDKGYTFSATAYLGARLWRGAEFYWNPEVVQGVPISQLQGLGGLTNGEAQRGAASNPTIYQARAFLRQTWDLGREREKVDSDFNQLAGSVAKRRISLTAGNLSVIDIFDRNQYAADPRTRLMNWAFLTHGSFDYAANARGYTWGAALEWFHDDWAVRAGRFLLPLGPNEQALDWAAARHFGDQVEVEHAHELASRPGKVRLLAFRNVTVMSKFTDALAFAVATGTTPDIDAVRKRRGSKNGIGLALEQEVTSDLGAWGRINWSNDGAEQYVFTTIDKAVAAGAVLKGTRWGRPHDSVALGMARNGLSSAHRQYLSAGGLDFFIGDGRLNYRPEQVIEAYYSLGVTRQAWLTLDWQRVRNPAYNADRGAVQVFGARVHAEF
jgi:high affinity Mn2+ porin